MGGMQPCAVYIRVVLFLEKDIASRFFATLFGFPKVVSAVLEEQHNVFVEFLNEAKGMEQHQRGDLKMLWESVGLRVRVLE